VANTAKGDAINNKQGEFIIWHGEKSVERVSHVVSFQRKAGEAQASP
jgi:hypothetical protein